MVSRKASSPRPANPIEAMATRVAIRQWSERLIIRAKSISWLGGRTNVAAVPDRPRHDGAGRAVCGACGVSGKSSWSGLGLARHGGHLPIRERKHEGSFQPLRCLEPVGVDSAAGAGDVTHLPTLGTDTFGCGAVDRTLVHVIPPIPVG